MEKQQTSRDYTCIRSIKRSVAKNKAKKDGYTRICHKPIVGNKDTMSMGMKAPDTRNKKGKSWFSSMWREIV